MHLAHLFPPIFTFFNLPNGLQIEFMNLFRYSDTEVVNLDTVTSYTMFVPKAQTEAMANAIASNSEKPTLSVGIKARIIASTDEITIAGEYAEKLIVGNVTLEALKDATLKARDAKGYFKPYGKTH